MKSQKHTISPTNTSSGWDSEFRIAHTSVETKASPPPRDREEVVEVQVGHMNIRRGAWAGSGESISIHAVLNRHAVLKQASAHWQHPW